ncbi:MAG TPA: hypothetical protein VKP11_08835 [Frankiaceae bacterium]|nr:hypothetical protein [Frankiaceae bacterium]
MPTPTVRAHEPLTGRPFGADPAARTRPALLVKIENAPESRP